jgi:hypothetical protein
MAHRHQIEHVQTKERSAEADTKRKKHKAKTPVDAREVRRCLHDAGVRMGICEDAS